MIDLQTTTAELDGSDLQLLKKALAIAVLSIERQPGPLQFISDQVNMKALLNRLIKSDFELDNYARSARAAREALDLKPRKPVAVRNRSENGSSGQRYFVPYFPAAHHMKYCAHR